MQDTEVLDEVVVEEAMQKVAEEVAEKLHNGYILPCRDEIVTFAGMDFKVLSKSDRNGTLHVQLLRTFPKRKK